MSRRHKPFRAFAVFGPDGRLETARARRDLAEWAARIIGGTDWKHHGFTVEPVTVTRESTSPCTHPDMIG